MSQSAVPERFNTTSAPRFTATAVPPMRWCGVHHAHGPHRYGAPGGWLTDCPGSTCKCDDLPTEGKP